MMHVYALALVLAFLVSAGTAAAGELYVASWNVENLFDPVDDPEVEGDEEFTPTAAKQYTPERYKAYLKNLARVLTKMNSDKGPDVLGLAEIENRVVLKDLVKELAPLGRDYRIVHKDSPSGRGIDCAILYDAKVVKALFEGFHFVDAGATRDIVEVELEKGGKSLTVFMNHWPAKANPEAHRVTAAKTLRKRLDAILKLDPSADFVVMGDLNDHFTSASIKTHLRTGDNPATLTPGQLFDTVAPLVAAGKGSYVFDNKWEMIDHMVVSPGLLDTANFQWKVASTEVVAFDFQIFTPANPVMIPRPNRLYTGDVFHLTGVSDHLPVACVLKY
jgi:predicted extracellular nuclease